MFWKKGKHKGLHYKCIHELKQKLSNCLGKIKWIKSEIINDLYIKMTYILVFWNLCIYLYYFLLFECSRKMIHIKKAPIEPFLKFTPYPLKGNKFDLHLKNVWDWRVNVYAILCDLLNNFIYHHYYDIIN